MKEFFLIICFLQFSLFSSAQTIQSNQISRGSGIHEKIDFIDEDGKTIISLAPRFYKKSKVKKWIKPIKVNDQTYFIKRKSKGGAQSIYSRSGKHVANIENGGYEIHLVDDRASYTLKPRIRLANLNILECRNSDGIVISTLSWKNDKRLTFETNNNQNSNLLLLSLCAHQYQELLLGDRGRLTASLYNSVWLCID